MRLRAKACMPEDAFGDLQGPDFTEQGQHAREVADWALPLEETLLRWEAVATAKTRLHRVRLCLREALAEYCVERRRTSA